MKEFTKHDAIQLWIAEHHPELAVRIDGFIVIGRDRELLSLMGEAAAPKPPVPVVEVNFDSNHDGLDWFLIIIV